MFKFSLEKAPLPPQEYNLEDLTPVINCHCCNDTGKIQKYLAKMVIPDYDDETDKQAVCQRMKCQLGLKFTTLIEMNLADLRFNHHICEELHKIGKEKKEKPDNLIEYQELLKKREMKKYQQSNLSGKYQQSNLSGRQWEQMQGEKYYGD